MNSDNPSQQQKDNVKQIFDLAATGYDNPAAAYFPVSADRLVSHLKPLPGSRVLDVATGTGMAAIALAQAIMPQGRVQAIDLSDKMLDKAFTNIQKTGLKNIDLHTMDAEQLGFRSKYFDAASCAFGLFFLPDMTIGVKEIFRVLKPGGRFIYTTFADGSFSPMIDLLREQIQNFGVEFPAGNWRVLSTEQECTQLLDEHGFEKTESHTEQLGYHIASSQDWWKIIWNSALRGLVEQLSAVQLDEFRDQHLAAVDKLAGDKGIWLDVGVLFTLGVRPA